MYVCMYVCKLYFKTLPHQHELVFMRGVKEEKKLKYLQITLNYYYTKLITLHTKIVKV